MSKMGLALYRAHYTMDLIGTLTTQSQVQCTCHSRQGRFVLPKRFHIGEPKVEEEQVTIRLQGTTKGYIFENTFKCPPPGIENRLQNNYSTSNKYHNYLKKKRHSAALEQLPLQTVEISKKGYSTFSKKN